MTKRKQDARQNAAAAVSAATAAAPSNGVPASARLALIGVAISTFGDALSTLSAALAIEEAEADNAAQMQADREQEEKLAAMQKQIDYLTQEVARLAQK
ncbi:hypothetical protein ACFFSY_04080 [Paenibacillus aurantiacus]|uniref:Translation initiation factor 2 n=1 Tax=Paenibacillus aurantiacus TaxID=1936118 RepID=A0ABV5KIR0_9BACL